MLRYTSYAVLTVLAVAASSHAAIIVEKTSAPTVGLPGFSTWTLTATAEANEKIVGFDFVGDGSLGFTGEMNQVNPIGMSTVFNDLNGFFGAADVSQDSQFKVASTKGLAVSASESATHLRAAFNYTPANVITDASNVWSFVQVAIPDAAAGMVNYTGTLTVNGPGGDRLEQVNGVLGGGTVGNPPVGLDTNLGDTALAIINHQFTATGDPTITWGSLTSTAGTPAAAATLSPTGQFQWHTIGSARPGTYSWNAVATNSVGSDNNVTLSLNLIVPEPATMTMISLAMVGLVGFGIRRRS